MKIFISQHMNGLTKEQILERRSKIIDYLRTQFEDFEVIDSVIDPCENPPLWYLGKSIQLLSEADLAVFDSEWYKSRGCLIEFKCCVSYGVKILFI